MLPHADFLDQAHIRTSAPGSSSPPTPARRARSTATPSDHAAARLPARRPGLPALLRHKLPDLVVALQGPASSRSRSTWPARPTRSRAASATPSKRSPTPRSRASAWNSSAARRACSKCRAASATAPRDRQPDRAERQGLRHPTAGRREVPEAIAATVATAEVTEPSEGESVRRFRPAAGHRTSARGARAWLPGLHRSPPPGSPT